MVFLTYHSLDDSRSVVSVSSRAFAAQMELLAARGMRGVSLAEALAHRAAHGSWPAKSVVLTFDDGFANFYEQGAPVLARHGFTATVFVISGHVGARNDWTPPPPGLGTHRMLSWGHLKELAGAGIEIGAHTRTHPDLRRLPVAELEREIAGSRAELEDRLARPVASFAYPFGLLDQMALGVVRCAFRAACTTTLRRASADAPHLLPRVDAYYLKSPRRWKLLLAGRLDHYLSVRRWGRSIRHALSA